jgi:hypothetical protein
MTGMIPGAEDEVGELDTGALEALLTRFGGAGPGRRAPAVFPELTTEAYQQAVEQDRAARPYDLLLQLGLGMMASRSPSLFGAIGEAGKTALANVEKTGNQNVRELVQKAQIGGQIAAGEQQRATRQALRTALDSDPSLMNDPAKRALILADPDGVGRAWLTASMQGAKPTFRTITRGDKQIDVMIDANGNVIKELGVGERFAPREPSETYTALTPEQAVAAGFPRDAVVQRSNKTGKFDVQFRPNQVSQGSAEERARAVLRTADPGSREFLDAWETLYAPRTQIMPDGTVVTVRNEPPDVIQRPTFGRPAAPPAQAAAPATEPAAPAQQAAPATVPEAAPPARSTVTEAPGATVTRTEPPNFMSPEGRKKLADAETELGKLVSAINNYRNALNAAGGVGLGTLMQNPRDPNVARILTSYNNLLMQLKSEPLYNLGVLNVGDLPRLQQAISDPTTLRGAAASKEFIDAQLNELRDYAAGNIRAMRDVYTRRPGQQGGTAQPPPPPAGFVPVQ